MNVLYFVNDTFVALMHFPSCFDTGRVFKVSSSVRSSKCGESSFHHRESLSGFISLNPLMLIHALTCCHKAVKDSREYIADESSTPCNSQWPSYEVSSCRNMERKGHGDIIMNGMIQAKMSIPPYFPKNDYALIIRIYESFQVRG